VLFEVVKQTAVLLTPSDPPTDAINSGGNTYIAKAVFVGVAFGLAHAVFRRRVPAGVAVPALKVRYKGNANVNNGGQFAPSPGDPVIARLSQISL
jgi:hypothetical protein